LRWQSKASLDSLFFGLLTLSVAFLSKYQIRSRVKVIAFFETQCIAAFELSVTSSVYLLLGNIHNRIYSSHWSHQLRGTRARPPLDLIPTIFFKVHFRAALTLTGAFVRLPLQTHLYSASAAAVVQSQLHEPCSIVLGLFPVIMHKTNNFYAVLFPIICATVNFLNTKRLTKYLIKYDGVSECE